MAKLYGAGWFDLIFGHRLVEHRIILRGNNDLIIPSNVIEERMPTRAEVINDTIKTAIKKPENVDMETLYQRRSSSNSPEQVTLMIWSYDDETVNQKVPGQPDLWTLPPNLWGENKPGESSTMKNTSLVFLIWDQHSFHFSTTQHFDRTLPKKRRDLPNAFIEA